MKITTHLPGKYLPLMHLFVFICLLTSCNNPGSEKTIKAEKTIKTDNKPDSLTEQQKHLPENALKGLSIAPGLEVHAFAVR